MPIPRLQAVLQVATPLFRQSPSPDQGDPNPDFQLVGHSETQTRAQTRVQTLDVRLQAA